MIENVRRSELLQSPEFEDAQKIDILLTRLTRLANTMKNTVFATEELANEAAELVSAQITSDLSELETGTAPLVMYGADIQIPNIDAYPYNSIDDDKDSPEDPETDVLDRSHGAVIRNGIAIGFNSQQPSRPLLAGETVEGWFTKSALKVRTLSESTGYALDIIVTVKLDEAGGAALSDDGHGLGMPQIVIHISQYANITLGGEVHLRGSAIYDYEKDEELRSQMLKKGINRTGFGKKLKKFDSLLYHEDEINPLDVKRIRIVRELGRESSKVARMGSLYSQLAREAILRQIGKERVLSVAYVARLSEDIELDETVKGELIDIVLPLHAQDNTLPALVIEDKDDDQISGPVRVINFEDIKSLSL